MNAIQTSRRNHARRIKLSLVACMLSVAALSPAAHAQATPACTITGTAAGDVLTGTAGRDVICGLGGNDTISGLGGNDVLIGGPGNDVLNGGAGNDSSDGGAGNDVLNGGAGNDTSDAGIGNDKLMGDAGSDKLVGGAGNDTLAGGAGSDSISGGAGNDQLNGGEGSDVLDPGTGTNFCPRGDQVIGSCTIDSSGPAISEVSVPSTVQAGESFTITWRLADPVGISYTGPRFGWASGFTYMCGPIDAEGTRSSGSDTDGAYSFTCKVPENAVATEYSVNIFASDGFSNLSESGWSYFNVVGANTDAQAPVYSNVKVIGTARVGEILTTTFTATDESGIGGAILWVAGPQGFTFDAPNSPHRVPYGDYSTLVTDKQCNEAGTSCTFTQQVRIAPNAEADTYTLYMSIVDIHGNKTLEQALQFPVIA